MITLEFPKGKVRPASARFAYVTDDLREAFVYFPQDARERKCAVLSATYDGVGLVRGNRGNVYFPIGWLIREYPKQEEYLVAMKTRLVELARNTGEADNDGGA